MTRIYVKPAWPGLIVRREELPHTPIPEDGAWLVHSRYVARRLRDGDLVECAPPADPESPPKAAPKKTATPRED